MSAVPTTAPRLDWRPPFQATDRAYRGVAEGQVIGYDYGAWEITHVSPMVEPDEKGYDTRVTLRRLHGPKHPRENDRGDMALRVRGRAWSPQVYRDGRVWLCSCCGDPVPCRMTVAEEESTRAAREFDKRLERMGPGICYSCGEVITTRQDRIKFPGEHADFPGRPAPTFHTRNKCWSGRSEYGRRAGLDADALPLLPFCEGHLTRHLDGSKTCNRDDCPGTRAEHRCITYEQPSKRDAEVTP